MPSRSRPATFGPVPGALLGALMTVAFAHDLHAETAIAQTARKLDFARDVLPILSDKCFLC